MKGFNLVLFALLLSMGFDLVPRSVRGQTDDLGLALLDLMEKHVGLIADRAKSNMEDQSGLVQSCDSSCSREECRPLSTDIQGYSCVKFGGALTGCPSSASSESVGPQPCNNYIRADLSTGYVRTPYDRPKVACEIRRSICIQRNLDEAFRTATKELRDLHNNEIYFHSFFGSVSGDFRYFPGREAIQDCRDKYDPRLRPWYSNAISVTKNMVVLLDNGISMAQKPSGVDQKTAFTAAQNNIELLLNSSVTEGDTITVITFNSTATLLSPQVAVHPGADVSKEIQPLLEAVRGAQEPMDRGKSNLSAGLELANTKLNGSSTLKVAVVFTTKKSLDPSSFTQAINVFTQESGVKLFIYAVGDPFTVQNATCFQYKAVGLGNPLLDMTSFFTFLARYRNVTQKAWQRQYNSSRRIGLGDVITVSVPALDSDRQLIGVAGIDVQTQALENITDLFESVNRALNKRLSSPPNVTGAALCQDTGITSQSCSNVTELAICPSTSSFSYLDLLCCEGCGGRSARTGEEPSNCEGSGRCVEPSPAPKEGCRQYIDCGPPLVKVMLPVVLGGLALLALSTWYIRKRFCLEQIPPANPPPLALSPPNSPTTSRPDKL